MKRTLVLFLIFIVSAGALYYLNTNKQSTSAENFHTRNFSCNVGQEIGRIEIKESSGRKVSLNYRDSNWYLYDQYLARQNAMDNLLEVIHGLKIQFIPSRAADKNIERDFGLIGIDVSIFDPQGDLLLNYIIGSVTQDERGTYARIKNANQAYVVHLPNLEGSIRGRFIMKNVEWRDRKLLNENIANITKIQMEYPKNQKESFIIEKDGSELRLKPINQVSFMDPEQSNKTLLHNYLKNFSILEAEYIENENPLKDSINMLVPFAILTVSVQNEEDKKLTLYPVDDILDGDYNTQFVNETKDISRYFIDCSWGDFMLVQQRLVGKFLRGYSYFFNS